MKPIEINEEQKEKLLEMCKALYKGFQLSNNFKQFKNGIIQFAIPVGRFANDETTIHWFEFCMTHLAKKLLYLLYVPKNANSEEGYQIGMEKFSNNALYYPKIHLVDYLYLEFKKL